MAEAAAQPALGPPLQHPVVGVNVTPPVAPLRLDSGKMVSLADLHVNSNTPTAPREADPTAIDPLDPLLQHLVQDKPFITAVQTSQLHAAAAAAVKVLKTFVGPSSGEFKRPVDPRRGPSFGGSPRFPSGPTMLSPGVRSMKQEVLQMEDAVPWTVVRRTWRNRRPSWRRQVKQSELVTDLAARLKELRQALLVDDGAFPGCGPSWKNQLDLCIQGRGTGSLLVTVWDEMKNTIRGWMCGAGAAPAAAGSSGPAPGAASTGRAVQALQAALRHDGTEALLQAPLEAIVGGDGLSLHAVRQAIDLERRTVSSKLAALQQGGGVAGVTTMEQSISCFDTLGAGWEDSDFDSAAETTPMDEGSDATDLDSDFDES